MNESLKARIVAYNISKKAAETERDSLHETLAALTSERDSLTSQLAAAQSVLAKLKESSERSTILKMLFAELGVDL